MTELPDGVIQLWLFQHSQVAGAIDLLDSRLHPDERNLRDRLEPAAALRFTASRGVLRTLLSYYAGIKVSDVRFRYGPRGKPFLEPASARLPGLEFNISDSGDFVAMGFSSSREIGVDIERVRHVSRWLAISRRFFGEDAAEQLAQLPEVARDDAFIGRWVREEARIKATGQGIWSRATPEALGLTFFDFQPGPGYKGSISAPGSDWSVSLHEWPALTGHLVVQSGHG